MMRLYNLTKIRYRESTVDSQANTRTIIPTEIPGNIKAIDVSELQLEQATQTAEYYAEYATYLNAHMKTAFSFEDWLSHTKGIDFTPKWRSFYPQYTEEESFKSDSFDPHTETCRARIGLGCNCGR